MSIRNSGGINYGAREGRLPGDDGGWMTTNPEEGRRQTEAMQSPKLKVGDKVRLAAGGERVMTVVELQDYDNQAVCEWNPKQLDVNLWEINRDTFPVRSLVLVNSEKE
jgi:hypothetical protein